MSVDTFHKRAPLRTPPNTWPAFISITTVVLLIAVVFVVWMILVR